MNHFKFTIVGESELTDDDDSVVGYLTAADVVKRVEVWMEKRQGK